MKASKLTYLLLMAVALTFVASGCKKKPVGVTELPGYANKRPGDPGPGRGEDPGGRLTPSGEQDPNFKPGDSPMNPNLADLSNYNQDRETLKTDMVHFDYDSAAIRANERSHVDAVVGFMKSAPANVALLVEGHCDERGTEEYNRALGERRALAIREALIGAGVDGMKITTRSFGKDRKIDLGPSEAAHAMNRRGEFVVLTPK